MNEGREFAVHLLDCLEAATGCPLVWKATSELLVDNSLPEKHRIHVQPFCLAIKRQGREFEVNCMRNDMAQVSRRALEQRTPFINVCHAGVAELIIPVFNGDHYRGAVMCGPFLTSECHCVFPDGMAEYRRLPWLSEERAAALAEVTTRVLQGASFIMNPPTKSDRDIIEPEEIGEPRIRAAAAYIRRHFRHSITVAEMTRQCALSRSRFLHLFKEQTGIGFSEYLQRLRIGEGRRLLIGTGLRMSEIAEACGIPDQSRFSALFRRYYQLSPLTYRRRLFKLPAHHQQAKA